MIYSYIKAGNISRYAFLAPERILGRIDNKSVRGLLATDDKGREAGILIFENESDMLNILWIYVLPGFRGRYIGDGLINDMLRHMENKEIRTICADIPEGENSDFLQSYLSRLGFRFQKSVSYEIMETPDELAKSFCSGITGLKPGISSLAETEEEFVMDYLENADDKKALKIYRENIPRIRWDVSTVHLNSSGRIDAILLIISAGDKILKPVLLEFEGKKTQIAAKLVSGSLCLCRTAAEKPEYVYISCTNEDSRTLVGLLFYDVHPIRVRHGILRG